MPSLSLIVRADDFGVCHAANQAILEAFETGLLTCASVLPAGPWMAEAAALVRAHPEWEIGVQLGITCATAGARWGPVAGAAAVPSLVEPTGTFPAVADAGRPEEIAREFAAQVERARAWGIAPAYLEVAGPGGPAVDAAVQALSEQLGMPARMAGWGLQPLTIPAQALHDETAARETAASLHAGAYLWATAPLQDAPEAWALWPDDVCARRYTEALLLRSPVLRAALAAHGVECISFRQHVEMRLGSGAELD